MNRRRRRTPTLFFPVVNGVSVPWTPARLGSAVTVWLKADSLSLNDADPISTWTNNGSGANFTGSGGGRPTYKTNILNSLPVARFDGGDVVVSGSTIANFAAKRGLLIAVVKPTQVGYGTLMATYNETGTNWSWYAATVAPLYNWFDGGVNNAAAADTSGTWVIKGFHRQDNTGVVAQRNGTDSDTHVIVNAQPSTTLVRVGGNTSGQYTTGDIAEIIHVSGDVSINTRQRIEGYLAHKWGLTANLPSDHPYKSSRPTAGTFSFTDIITFNGSDHVISGTKAGTLTADGTYKIPYTLTGSSVAIVGYGAGGDGRADGTGGGGGGYSKKNAFTCVGGDKLHITISTSTDETGTQVLDDLSNDLVFAGGGMRDGTPGPGGGSGSDIHYDGGAGGTSHSNQGGGGGGSSAGTGANGNTGADSNSAIGGNGGTAPTGGYAGGDGGAEGFNGHDGSNYGGGGGGGGNGVGGGLGGIGVVFVSGTFTA